MKFIFEDFYGTRLSNVQRESGDTTTIDIPAGTKVIGPHALDGCSSAVEINLPDSVEIIDKYAFNNCVHLKHIKLPKSIKEIGDGAFHNCKIIESIHLPNVEYIGPSTFAGCGLLKSITLGDSLKYLGEKVFDGCFSLKEVKIPIKVNDSNFLTINSKAFDNCCSLNPVEYMEDTTAIEGMIDDDFEKHTICLVTIGQLYAEALNKPDNSKERIIFNQALDDFNDFLKRHGYSTINTKDTLSIPFWMMTNTDVYFNKATGVMSGFMYPDKTYTSFKSLNLSKPFCTYDYVPKNANFTWKQLKELRDIHKQTVHLRKASYAVTALLDKALKIAGTNIDINTIELDENKIDVIEKHIPDLVFIFDKYGNLKNYTPAIKLIINEFAKNPLIIEAIIDEITNSQELSEFEQQEEEELEI